MLPCRERNHLWLQVATEVNAPGGGDATVDSRVRRAVVPLFWAEQTAEASQDQAGQLRDAYRVRWQCSLR